MRLNIGWSLGSHCPFSCLHCYTRIDRSGVRELDMDDVRKVVDFVRANNVGHITLGGNEPWFSGVGDSLLPTIIESLAEQGVQTSLVTSGPSALKLGSERPDLLESLVNVAVSLDAPDADRHNSSRGAALWPLALEALRVTATPSRKPLIIWVLRRNSSPGDIPEFSALAREYGALFRINLLKPNSVDLESMFPAEAHIREVMAAVRQHFETRLSTDALLDPEGTQCRSCPCGNRTFRIGFKTPIGEVPVHSCQYHRPQEAPSALVGGDGDVLELLSDDPVSAANRENPGCGTLRSLTGATIHQRAVVSREVPPQLRVWLNYLPTWVGEPRRSLN